jgi:hypothetical protein
MAPTIRIDDDVYSWLQQQARPFEDTPNTVLRRVAGLDEAKLAAAKLSSLNTATSRQRTIKEESDNQTDPPEAHKALRDGRIRGAHLNKLWKVGAVHALYRETGDWYQNLLRFPGALFDANGYVLFESEKAYRECPHVSIAQTTHVQSGISSLPNYVRVK